MLTLLGITLVMAGTAWLVAMKMRSRPGQRGQSLGELEVTCEVMAGELGWDLRDESQRELFLTGYREQVRTGNLPRSAEWDREVFGNQDGLERNLENARRASITLWYIMDQLECHKLQAALLEYIYRLYDACSKPTGGLRAELGPRTGLPRTG